MNDTAEGTLLVSAILFIIFFASLFLGMICCCYIFLWDYMRDCLRGFRLDRRVGVGYSQPREDFDGESGGLKSKITSVVAAKVSDVIVSKVMEVLGSNKKWQLPISVSSTKRNFVFNL